MGTESEKGNRRLLNTEEAREQLAEAWLDFWSGSRTPNDSETRNRRIREVLEKLSPSDREYFLSEEGGQESELAKIREEAKMLARTGKKSTLSAGEKLHLRRQKANKHGTNPKRIH